MDCRHIIPRIEVIEAKLGVEVVAAVKDGVDLSDGFVAVGFIASGHIAPCVVEVKHDRLTVGIGDREHVVLCVFEVIICVAIVGEAEDVAALVVHKDKHVVARFLSGKGTAVVEILRDGGRICTRILQYLFCSLAVDIVFVADIRRAVFPGTLQLSAFIPCKGHAVPVLQRIADFVIGNGLSVEACQQIRPGAVGIPIGFHGFAVLRNRSYVAVLIAVFGGDAAPCDRFQLVQAVIGIAFLHGAVFGDLGNVPDRVVGIADFTKPRIVYGLDKRCGSVFTDIVIGISRNTRAFPAGGGKIIWVFRNNSILNIHSFTVNC